MQLSDRDGIDIVSGDGRRDSFLRSELSLKGSTTEEVKGLPEQTFTSQMIKLEQRIMCDDLTAEEVNEDEQHSSHDAPLDTESEIEEQDSDELESG